MQLDLTDGRFRDQIADLAAPVHGMAKDELASEDVRQHRRALRHAIAAGIALVFLTLAAIATSVFAVNAAARADTAQRNADSRRAPHRSQTSTGQRQAEPAGAHAREEGDRQRTWRRAARAGRNIGRSGHNQQPPKLATATATSPNTANGSLNTGEHEPDEGSPGVAEVDVAREARLAARRQRAADELGDQTYQLGVRSRRKRCGHASAQRPIDPTSSSCPDTPIPIPAACSPVSKSTARSRAARWVRSRTRGAGS